MSSIRGHLKRITKDILSPDQLKPGTMAHLLGHDRHDLLGSGAPRNFKSHQDTGFQAGWDLHHGCGAKSILIGCGVVVVGRDVVGGGGGVEPRLWLGPRQLWPRPWLLYVQ